jgi:hypothetical protein
VVPDVVVGRIYLINPKGVHWGSNPGIWMAMKEMEHCCSVDRHLSPLLYAA